MKSTGSAISFRPTSQMHASGAGDAARKGAMEKHRSIKISTYGIIFMGTPHQGSGNVQIGKSLLNIARVFVETNDRLIKNLEEYSEWLQQQLGQYGPISGDFVTKFAYEEYKTPTVMGHSIMRLIEQVVPRESAVVPGAADTEAIVIHANHINMVKFPSKEINGYRTVSGHLRIMADEACNVIATRWEEEKRINSARDNSGEKFSLVFSLYGFIETNNFVARQEELAAMHETLGSGIGRRTVILHGLGGIGKTQLAIQYAKTYSSDYSAVLLLNIKDKDSVKQSYVKISEQIRNNPSASQLNSINGDSPGDDIVTAVKRWLDHAQNTRWLMVFDNYDNPKVPGNADPGKINIEDFLPTAYHGSVIVTTRVSKVDIGRQMKIGKLGNIYDSLQILSDASHRRGVMEDPKAAELAKELDGLPLALATAGAYLKEVTFSFEDYLEAYHTSWRELQRTSPQLTSYEDRQLYSTWQLCVHSWTIHVLNEKWDPHTAGFVVECIGMQIPKESSYQGISERMRLARIQRHAARCGLLYEEQGQLEEAEKWYQRAAQGYKKVEGQKKYSKASEMFRKVDHIRKQLGKETEQEREEAERKRRKAEKNRKKAARKREKKARQQNERQSES
ncbi:MAG: hypothetical protein Q9161_002901 [Pseudevernia consocians]